MSLTPFQHVVGLAVVLSSIVGTASGQTPSLERSSMSSQKLLADRPHLFGELRSAIEGISAKVLAQKLRLLESDGLVDRRVLPTRRVTVAYSLTPLGQTLTGPLETIRDWAEQHIGEIQQANLQSRERAGIRKR
jgi:DNA-binding HxlR family transcriptional regulator